MKSSSRPRILVLGGTGMLGHKLTQVLSTAADVHAAARRQPPRFVASSAAWYLLPDLSHASLRSVVDRAAPDVILNAIGAIKQRDVYSAIEETFYVNGVLPHLLADVATSRGARLIHFSTDCVFNGDRGHYSEDDRPDAEDVYGRSKAMGEVDYGNHLTIRTSIVGFELSGHLGLLAWFLKQPRGTPVSGYTRAIYSGLPTVTLARLVHDIILRLPALRGLYHVASEPIDKYTLLSRVNVALEAGHVLHEDPSVCIDRSLSDSRFRRDTATVRPTWAELVRDLRDDFQAGPYPSIYEFAYA